MDGNFLEKDDAIPWNEKAWEGKEEAWWGHVGKGGGQAVATFQTNIMHFPGGIHV